MKVRFDENNDMVIDDIPNDMMTEIERRAFANGWSAEAELRDILLRTFSRKSEVSV